MANGRGALECCYCVHYQALNGGLGYGPGCGEGSCTYWNVDLPVIQDHRICADFTPNEAYARDNGRGRLHPGQTVEESVQERMSWFGRELKPGVLYAFCYNDPPGIKELLKLAEREADWMGEE